MSHGAAQDDRSRVGGLVGVVGLIAASLTDGVVRWVAVAAVLAVLPGLARRLARHPAWARRRERTPFAVVAVACAWLLSELVVGHPPASRDHALHLFEIHLLVDEFLPSGRVSGWTDAFNNGLPFGEAYPWFCDLWAAAAHLLSFGLVSQRTSYAWGLLAIWLLAVAGVWLIAAEITREIAGRDPDIDARTAGVARWAGCIAGLTWLLDPGGSREGGWNYLMFHGVWPQLLSATLWVLALPLAWRAYTRPSPRRLGLVALVLGGSVLAHPFGILTLVCSATVWLAVLAFSERGRSLPAGRFVWWTWTHLAATVIGLGWLVTFLAGAEALGRSPVPWDPMASLATALLFGTLFSGHAAWTGPLVVIGTMLAVRRGAAIAWLTVGLALGMLVLGSHEAITVLRLDLLAAGFKNLQFPRYAIAIKPLLFALAGVGGAVATRALLDWLPPRRRTHLHERFVGALVLAPFAVAFATHPGRLVTRPVGGIESLERAGEAEHEAALRQALVDERQRLGDTALTVAFFRRGMGGGMVPAMSVAAAGGRLILDGHVATVNFEHGFVRRSLAGLTGMQVTHVIYDQPLTERADDAIAAALFEVGTFGPYTLARLQSPPSQAGNMPVTWTTSATIDVLPGTADHWTLQASNVTTPVDVRLPIPPHPKWTATLDGAPLALAPTQRWGGAATGTLITLPHDGRVTLTYTDTLAERRARWAALVVALFSLAALASGAPLNVRPWRPSMPMRRGIAFVLAIVVAAGVDTVRRRQNAQLAATWEEQTDGQTFVADLVVDREVDVVRTPDRVCVGIGGKDALDGCSEQTHAPQPSFMYRDPYVYRCLRFTVPPHGTAVANVPAVGEGRTLLGAIRREDRKGKGAHLTFRTGGRWRSVGNEVRVLGIRGDASAGPASITIRNESGRQEPVCLAVAVVQD